MKSPLNLLKGIPCERLKFIAQCFHNAGKLRNMLQKSKLSEKSNEQSVS